MKEVQGLCANENSIDHVAERIGWTVLAAIAAESQGWKLEGQSVTIGGRTIRIEEIGDGRGLDIRIQFWDH